MLACLQCEVCTNDFFLSYDFLTKNGSKISPKLLSLSLFCGSKKSRKIPTTFPCENLRKFTDVLLEDRRENKVLLNM